MKFYLVSCMALAILLGTFISPAKNETAPAETEKSKVELLRELVPICACESTGRKDGIPTQFDENGKVLRGKKNPNDIGMCQINLKFHQAKAQEMGLDLFEEEDNIIYANWLYSNEGSTPWNWSKDCWQ